MGNKIDVVERGKKYAWYRTLGLHETADMIYGVTLKRKQWHLDVWRFGI